jgi:hypothetical protein
MEIKTRLLEQLSHLKKEYLSNCQIDLHLMEDEENDGTVFYEIIKKSVKFSIFLALNLGEMDKHDIYICHRYNLKTREQLFSFIFYHEFYHAVQMNKCFLEKGAFGIESMLNEIERKIKKINKLNDDIEKSILYREIEWEKEADLFAINQISKEETNE